MRWNCPLKRLRYIELFLLLSLALVVSCARLEVLPKSPTPFNQAIRLLAANLLAQVQQAQGLLGRVGRASRPLGATLGGAAIVVVPFVDGSSGEAVQVTKEIERNIFSEFRRVPGLTIEHMTAANLTRADYVMVGILLYQAYPGGNAGGDLRRYHVFSSIIDRETRDIVGNADIWISETDLDYTPAAIYENSPMYPRDRRLQSLVAITRSPVGTQADREYFDSLETNALLVEAENVYEAKDYTRSLALFSQAAQRGAGQVMKTYIGLYKSNIMLGDMEGAESAFGKLVAVGVENHNISTKFLFSVDSTEFNADQGLRKQYAIWVRQIAEYFGTNNRCINVIGHSSKTGPAEYNDRLSLSRAKRIQKLMGRYSSSILERSKASGKGFRQNIVGSGTDDARDALDRRVEFSLVGCR